MASTSQIVNDLMDEIGKDSPDIAHALELTVGEVVVELLGQNEGRFSSLSKTETLSILTTQTRYILPADFNTAKVTSTEVDTDGTLKGIIYIMPKAEIQERLVRGGAAHARFCYVEFSEDGYNGDGRGYYLTLAKEVTENTTYEFEYYRKPVTTDVDLIRNPGSIKRGVRANSPKYFPENNDVNMAIYENVKKGFSDKPQRYATSILVTPSPQTSRRNVRMHRIGRGG